MFCYILLNVNILLLNRVFGIPFCAGQLLLIICPFFCQFRSIYSPYDPFLATSLAQVQANGLAAAAAAAAGNPGLDPRLQVIFW